MKSIGRTANKNDTARVSSGIELNATASVKIADVNPDRIYFYVTADGSKPAVWLKLQATLVDDDKKGIYLGVHATGRRFWEMPSDNIYTGEICAIAEADSPDVHVTEY